MEYRKEWDTLWETMLATMINWLGLCLMNRDLQNITIEHWMTVFAVLFVSI